MSVAEALEFVLPIRWLCGERHLDGRDFVLRAIGGPIGVVGGHHIGSRVRVVERGVNDTRLHPFGDFRPKSRRAGTTLDRDPVALPDSTIFGVMRMQFEEIGVMPCPVLSPPRLGADVVLAQDAASGEDERELARGSLGRRDILRDDKASLSSDKRVDVHDGRAFRGLGIAGPLDAPEAFQPFVAHASEGGSQCSDLVHDLGRMLIMHGVAQGFG